MRNSILKSTLIAAPLLLAMPVLGHAQGVWTAAPDQIDGSLRAGSREVPVQPGDKTQLAVRNVTPGASITVLRGTELLTPEPLVADEKGAVAVPIQVPADAEVGNQPLTVISQNPAGVALVNLKLSRVVAPLNVDAFDLATAEVGERAYQADMSADGKLFVASARGPNEESRLVRLNAETLELEAEAEIAPSADPKDGLIDVFGVEVDDAHGNVWTINTLNETVTVYGADDLKVVKAFEEGSIAHPRDILIDQDASRAYVSVGLGDKVAVYDTATLERVGTLYFEAEGGRDHFGSMTLALDKASGRLWSVSRDTPFVGWVDVNTGASDSFEVPQIVGGSGIAHDPETGRIWLTGQESDNVVLIDEEGEVIADTYVGAGGLSIVWDPVTKQAYTATRAGGTIAVLDADAKLVANLPLGDLPNEVSLGTDGTVFAVAMYGTPGDDDQTGTITRITPKR